jgi:hypothetical protein
MILVLGDSHSYGHGLRRCEFSTDPPSPFAWCYQLDREVDNRSKPGASNAEIAYNFTQFFAPEKYSAVIVVWSFLTRVFHPDHQCGGMLRSVVPSDHDVATFYSKYYDERVANLELAAYISLIEKISTVPVLHDFIDKDLDQALIDRVPKALIDPGNYNSFLAVYRSTGFKPGFYGHHFSEAAHAKWAKEYVVPALLRHGL